MKTKTLDIDLHIVINIKKLEQNVIRITSNFGLIAEYILLHADDELNITLPVTTILNENDD